MRVRCLALHRRNRGRRSRVAAVHVHKEHFAVGRPLSRGVVERLKKERMSENELVESRSRGETILK